MRNVKITADAPSKGLTLTAQMLKFTMGLVLAVVVAYSTWWLFFHNYYERIAETNTAKLVNKIDLACQTGQTQSMFFYMPQKLGFSDLVKQQTKITKGFNIGTDPYFYVYWEQFPPEPPYDIADIAEGDVLGTGLSIVAPWSEDLPWSSNLLLTAAADSVFLGFAPGHGKVTDQAKKIKRSITESEELGTLVKAGRTIDKTQKVVLGNKKVLVGVAAAGTILCKYYYPENSWEECAVYTTVGYIGARVAYYGVKAAAKKLSADIHTSNVKMGVNSLEKTLNDIPTEAAEEQFKILQKPIKVGGKDIKFIESVDEYGRGVVSSGDHWDSLEAYWIKEGEPEKIGAYTFVKESKTGKLKTILMEKTGLTEPWKKVVGGWNNLKESIGHLLGSDVLTPGANEIAANAMEVSVKKNPEAWQKIFRQARIEGVNVPVDTTNLKNIEEYALKQAGKIRTKGQTGFITLIEKDRELAKILSRASDQETLTNELIKYFDTTAANPEEAKHLANWIMGKEYRVADKVKKYGRGSLGYAFLRVQDLYTPAGMTYLDKMASSYTFTGTYCEDGEICLQMGYYVRKYPLPESCEEKGITQIKLKRDSIVSKDPRFYLVSPCFSHLDISKQGDTVYIEPKMCEELPQGFEGSPNYCYATAGTVNFYVGTETVSFFADCITTAVCAAVTAPATAGFTVLDAIKACTSINIPSGPCGWLGQAFQLAIDVGREMIVTYPYVPEFIQDTTWGGACSSSILDESGGPQ